MRTGEIAAIMGVSHVTIRAWIDHESLNRFFSASARGVDGMTQRSYTDADVLVLNTVRHLRAGSPTATWEEIAAYLDTGQRENEFPLTAASVGADKRTIPLQQAEQSAKAAATLAERDAALSRVAQLEGEVTRLQSLLRDEQNAHRETLERLMREIAELRYKIGALESERGKP